MRAVRQSGMALLLLVSVASPAWAQQLTGEPSFPTSITLLYADAGAQPLTTYATDPQSRRWTAAAQVAGINGQSYRVMLWHRADPARLRVWAVDGDALSTSAPRYEVALTPAMRFDGDPRFGRSYVAPLTIAPSSRPPSLRFEWLPDASGFSAPEALWVSVDSAASGNYGVPPLLGRGTPPDLIPPQNRRPPKPSSP